MYIWNILRYLINKTVAKRQFAISLIVASVMVSIGCEDVIQVDLEDAEPRIIIEATITNERRPYVVIISRSTDYFNPAYPPRVPGALVTVSDDAGNIDTFTENTSQVGVYYSDSLEGIPGRTYYLTVLVEGKKYEAVSTMPQPLEIDSLGYEYQPGDEIEDEGFLLHCYFQDPPDRDDYARIKIRRNGRNSDNMYLYDGDWSDGKSIDYNYFWEIYGFGEVVEITFRTINHETLIYYLTLMEIIATDDGGMIHGVPANPTTNLTNGALGYFATYTISHQSIIMPFKP